MPGANKGNYFKKGRISFTFLVLMCSVAYAHIKNISVRFISGSLGLKSSQRPFELTNLSVFVATHCSILA